MRIVIVGAGETGMTLAHRFSTLSWDVVLVDLVASALGEADELDVMTLVGDATHRPVLHRAGAARADAFVTVSGSDSQNLLSAALARRLGAKVAVARVDDPAFFAPSVHMETDVLGVDAVVCTPRLIAERLLDRVLSMHFDLVDSFALEGVRVGVLAGSAAPSVIGLSGLNIKLPGKAQLAAVLRDGYVRPPSEIDKLSDNDRLVIAGPPSAVAAAWRQLVPGVADARAVVIGGGDVGVTVLDLLNPHIDRLELVEIDRDRARFLAEEHADVSVLCGDGRRHAFLEDMQIGSASFVIATTADDETGLLISLLARRLGVAQTFSFIRQPGHDQLFRAVGIEGATGLFDVLARAVESSITGSGIVRQVKVPGTSYDLVEWRVARAQQKRDAATPGLTPTPTTTPTPTPTIDQLPLPARCRAIALARNFEAMPLTGATRLQPGDTLVILAPHRAVADLGRRLTRFDKGKRK